MIYLAERRSWLFFGVLSKIMAINPYPQATLDLIKLIPDAAHGLAAQLSCFFHSHSDVFNQKASVIENAALRQLGIETVKSIFHKGQEIFSISKGREMTVEDLDRVPAEVGDAFIRESQYVQDDYLKSLWASLLASYVSNCEDGLPARKAFASVLKELAPLDAICLQKIYSIDSSTQGSTATLHAFQGLEKPDHQEPVGELIYAGKSIATVLLPERAFLCSVSRDARIPELERALRPELAAALGNLGRLGLVEFEPYQDGGSDPRRVFHTAFGHEFSKAIFMVAIS